MGTTYGKLELRVTVPTGGWTGTIDDSNVAGPAAWTLPAGDYYLSSKGSGANDLLAELENQLNIATPTDTITVTISAGENGTGKVTITSTGTTAIVFTSTALRDLLGFVGNLSGGTSYTGTWPARSLWLPNSPLVMDFDQAGGFAGWPESDFTALESRGGAVYALAGRRRRATKLAWFAVTKNKAALSAELVAGESFEQWWIDGIVGEATWAKRPGGPFRLYPNAANDADYRTFSSPALPNYRPDLFTDGYSGLCNVVIPRAVMDPNHIIVPTDGPGGVFVPYLAAHFTQLGIAQPVSGWPSQELAGNLSDAIAAVALTPNASPLYAQSLNGWQRKMLQFTEAANQRFFMTAGTYNPSTSSAAALVYFQLTALPGGSRIALVLGSTGAPVCYLRFESNGKIAWNINAVVTTGTYNYFDGAMHPLLAVFNRTAGTAVFYTDKEQLAGTYFAGVADNIKGLGTNSGTAPPAYMTEPLWWYGANAELVGKASVAALGWPLAY